MQKYVLPSHTSRVPGAFMSNSTPQAWPCCGIGSRQRRSVDRTTLRKEFRVTIFFHFKSICPHSCGSRLPLVHLAISTFVHSILSSSTWRPGHLVFYLLLLFNVGVARFSFPSAFAFPFRALSSLSFTYALRLPVHSPVVVSSVPVRSSAGSRNRARAVLSCRICQVLLLGVLITETELSADQCEESIEYCRYVCDTRQVD